MGRHSETLEALPNDQARIDRVLKDLDAALEGQASATFIEGVVMNWSDERYVRDLLAEPVGDALHFAGEATSRTAIPP